jgi:hypothetical protein
MRFKFGDKIRFEEKGKEFRGIFVEYHSELGIVLVDFSHNYYKIGVALKDLKKGWKK